MLEEQWFCTKTYSVFHSNTYNFGKIDFETFHAMSGFIRSGKIRKESMFLREVRKSQEKS